MRRGSSPGRRTRRAAAATVRRVRERSTVAPARPDLLLAAGLTVVGVLEAAFDGSGHDLVRALTLPLATLALAWRRTLPLLPLAAVAAVLGLQVAFADFFHDQAATLLVAAVVALYSAGRYAASPGGLAAAGTLAAALAAIRVAFDPVVAEAPEALLTVVGVSVPLLAGRWIGGQDRLQRELEAESGERERARARDARHAAEEERMRIADDLEVAVADRLDAIAALAPELRARLEEGAHDPARALLARIADSARDALADVRRVLGILRRDGDAPSRAPLPAGAVQPLPPRAAEPLPDPPPAAAAAPPRDLARFDRILVLALIAAAQLEFLFRASGTTDHLIGALTAFPVALPLLWRRTHPIPAALAALAAVALQSALLRPDYFPAADGATLVCAAYAIGAYAERRTALAGIGALAVGEAAHALAFHPQSVGIAVFAAAIVPWTIGRIARSQRALTATVREHAAQVERTRLLEARAAVTAERMRVARELHDAVAHNLSVIAIQAAGAQGIVERDPARARECADLIEAVTREAAGELGRLAGDRRTAPPPSLARVEALAQRARDGGLPVELRVEGEPARLPAGVDLAGFRIVQEALTNAAKHAGRAHARVIVRYLERALELEIDDDGRGPAPRNGARAEGSGHGLIGMRERAALYGGTLDAGGRPGGGFAVHARLPLERP